MSDLGKDVGGNDLAQWGIDYDAAMMLLEYGLLKSDSAVQQDVVPAEYPGTPLLLAGKEKFYLSAAGDRRQLVMTGLPLSEAGSELISVLDRTPDLSYALQLEAHLRSAGWEVARATAEA
jgi:hypothetical protein